MKLKNLFPLMLVIIAMTFLSSCQEDNFNDDPSTDTSEVPFAQKKRTCLTHEHTQHLMQDPVYQAKRQKMLLAFEKVNVERANFKVQCSSPVLIPVAIHYQGVNDPNATCLNQLAINQINTLNEDYAGTNSDISKWTSQAASFFPGVDNGETCMKFVIADQNHPSGYGLNNGDLAITINRTQGDQVNNWSGYINIFVQFNTGVLGYAPLGGLGNGDGVVIDAAAFGSGQGCGSIAPEAPYNLGRTLTHEMGHYLLLDHIWGDGCGVDDDVSDTPDQAQDNAGCPSLGTTSCGSNDMHMNYMDYTNDACMYMFSGGQSARMSNYLSSSLSALTSNVSNVYSGSTNAGSGDTNDDDTSDGSTGEEDTEEDDTNDGETGEEETEEEIDDELACASPTLSTTEILSPTKVKIDWADITDAIRYQVRYRVTGTSQWERKNASNSQKNLNNLSTSEYHYQIRTRCSDGWQAWSSIQTFDLSIDEESDEGTDSESGSYKVQVTLDEYGSETSWELYDASNNLVASGGPYEDGQEGQVKTKNVDLEDGCYEIDLYDAFGDGMCCDYGDGGLEIVDANGTSLISSDGNFGTYELIEFCVENGRARITKRERDNKKLSRGKKK